MEEKENRSYEGERREPFKGDIDIFSGTGESYVIIREPSETFVLPKGLNFYLQD